MSDTTGQMPLLPDEEQRHCPMCDSNFIGKKLKPGSDFIANLCRECGFEQHLVTITMPRFEWRHLYNGSEPSRAKDKVATAIKIGGWVK